MKKNWKEMTKDEIREVQNEAYELHLIPDGEGSYVAVWPALPGCAACGGSLEEALAKAKEAKTSWFKALILQAFAAEDLQEADVYEEDETAYVMDMLTSNPPAGEDLAIKDTLIDEGDAVVLVKDTEDNIENLVKRLEAAGFDEEPIVSDNPVNGVYVNLYFEVFAYSYEGIKIAQAFHNRGVSAADFEHLAVIFERNGSLYEGLSEVDAAEINRIYSDSTDLTFGELIEKYRLVYSDEEKKREVKAGSVSFMVPEEWTCESESDGSGFFCTAGDDESEFSAYYAAANLQEHETSEEIFDSLEEAYMEDESGLQLVRREALVMDEKEGQKFVFSSADGQDEITRMILLNGRSGLLQIEYRIVKNKIAYMQEIMEEAAHTAAFLEEESDEGNIL